SCCIGSSQRGAILVCHANVMLPLGTTFSWALCANGAVIVASAAVLSTLRRVSAVLSIISSINKARPIARLALELNVFPGIAIAGGDRGREHVLPFRRRDARPNHVDEGVAEHREEIVIFENPALDLFGERPALGRLLRCQILVELGIEVA